ncbi:MAG: DUF4270 family protein [Saprospiraceae bacterium]|nr:DUF4270 family protein [Saprospiraceae bacterium]MBK8485378.1 DUF4270 family protein [Saprospiraceae bacterium]MBK9720372.1 DUF4270 family protein [Saprospiraceae bacterium]MBK9727342.1 DUF4270 family protein [Saprospiraceae bacterium]
MIGKISLGFSLLIGSLLIVSSCNDIDSFGSDILDSGWLQAKGVDTFNFDAGVAPYDSTITFKNFTTLGSVNFLDAAFPLGKMLDPVFGKVAAGFGTQLRIIPSKNTDFLSSSIDSIVVSLRFDTSLFYGKYAEKMNIAVYPLVDPYNVAATYYSNHKLNYDKTLKLGEVLNYEASKKDSLPIIEDTFKLKLYSQLRFQLDTAAFMKILRSYPDTVYYTVDSFSKIFNGIAFVCEQGNGILSVLPEHTDSKITIYYHNTGATQSKRELFMSNLAVKTPFYEIDNTNSIAGDCINGTISSDSLLSIQGFEGRDIQLKIPYDNSWNNKFINFAVLQFYVAEQAGDDLVNFPLPTLLEIFDRSTGTRIAIDDVALGLNSLNTYTRVFGGNPVKSEVDGKTVYLYKMNITRHFQNSLRAKKDMDLVISPLFKLETAARTIFFGQGNHNLRAKLILTYSE